MNNKGQTLVIFIIILPLIILAMAFIVDTGLMIINKSKLDSTSKVIIDKYYDYEGDINLIVKEYLENNNIKYTNYSVRKDSNLAIEIESTIDSIFGKVINLKEYKIKSKITGYKVNDKIKFKNE